MEHIDAIITHALQPSSASRISQTAQGSMRNISAAEMESRRRILAKILLDDRIAHNYEPRPPEETDIIVQAFLPVTRCIPVRHLYECYVAGLEARHGGNNFQITAVEMVHAWKGLQGRLEKELIVGRKLLPEHAATACQRCFGSGREEMPDGSVRAGCEHIPFTPEELKERAQAKAKMIQSLRAQARQIRAAKSLPNPSRQ